MRLLLFGLLALLAACSDAPAPAEIPARGAETELQIELQESPPPALAGRGDSADWMAIEHAGWPERPAEVLAPVLSDPGPVLAIIIDDVGHAYAQGRRIIDMPVPIALAILPHTQFAQRLAQEAAEAGRTVMLHQPMENGAGLDIGPGGLYSGMPEEEFDRVLRDNLNSFVPIQGLNNHMGSRLTAEREPMDRLMRHLHGRQLFFIDSRTTAATQAAFAAEAAGVRHLSRDQFLDHVREPQAIAAAFEQGLRLARQNGQALLIGHPYPETLDYLERVLPELEAREGVRVVGVEELLARKYAR